LDLQLDAGNQSSVEHSSKEVAHATGVAESKIKRLRTRTLAVQLKPESLPVSGVAIPNVHNAQHWSPVGDSYRASDYKYKL